MSFAHELEAVRETQYGFHVRLQIKRFTDLEQIPSFSGEFGSCEAHVLWEYPLYFKAGRRGVELKVQWVSGVFGELWLPRQVKRRGGGVRPLWELNTTVWTHSLVAGNSNEYA